MQTVRIWPRRDVGIGIVLGVVLVSLLWGVLKSDWSSVFFFQAGWTPDLALFAITVCIACLGFRRLHSVMGRRGLLVAFWGIGEGLSFLGSADLGYLRLLYYGTQYLLLGAAIIVVRARVRNWSIWLGAVIIGGAIAGEWGIWGWPVITAFVLRLFLLAWVIRYPNGLFELRPPVAINLLYTITIAIVLAPYVFHYGASDADILTMHEWVGHLLQGHPIHAAPSGLGDEILALRYPAGFPVVAILVSHLVRIPPSVVMIWIGLFSYALIHFFILRIGQQLGLGRYKYLAGIFLLSETLLGDFGLRGGQIQELLTYALGCGAILLLLKQGREDLRSVAWLLSAGALIHPLVVLPFGAPFAAVTIRSWMRRELSLSETVRILIPFGFAASYFWFLNRDTVIPSQPSVILAEISWATFVQNIRSFLSTDSHHMAFALLALPIAAWRRESRGSFGLILLWLLGALLIDGLFGEAHRLWGARFQASCSSIAVCALAVGVMASLFHQALSTVPRWRTKPEWKVALVSGVILFFWMSRVYPSFVYVPWQSFVLASDVRAGDWAQSHLPEDVVIYPIVFPPDEPLMSLSVRMHALRASTTARITEHQLKRPRTFDRSVIEGCIKVWTEESARCLGRNGVTHLWVSRRNAPTLEIGAFGRLVHKEGGTSIFELSSHDP